MPSTKSTDVHFDVSLSSLRTVNSLASAAKGRSVADRQVVERARQLLQARKKFVAMGPKGLFRDSAWDMMLELFISGEEGGILYVKQMMIASGDSPAAAMRRIDRLDEAEFIKRKSDILDQRRVIVSLTERGRAAMLAMLKHVFDPAPAPAPVAFKPPRKLPSESGR